MAMPTKVLIIDDDPDIQQLHKLVLETAGYGVLLASSDAEGRVVVDSERPDVVLLDIMMEQADAGFQTARWLAENHPNVPVMMLSSIADASDSVFDTSTLRVADLVNKPIAPQDLLDGVKRLLERAARLR
jgi:DNA-binding response OmpR family regulator